MKIIFDQGVPVPLRRHLSEHVVNTAYEPGWHTLDNGDLLDEVEAAGYEVLITTDKNIQHQQNLANRTFAVLILPSPRWPTIEWRAVEILEALNEMAPGAFVELP